MYRVTLMKEINITIIDHPLYGSSFHDDTKNVIKVYELTAYNYKSTLTVNHYQVILKDCKGGNEEVAIVWNNITTKDNKCLLNNLESQLKIS